MLPYLVEAVPHPPGRCSVPGCPASHNAKGYCRRHYHQMYHSGSIAVRETRATPCPAEIGNPRESLAEAQRLYPLATGPERRRFWFARILQCQKILGIGANVAIVSANEEARSHEPEILHQKK